MKDLGLTRSEVMLMIEQIYKIADKYKQDYTLQNKDTESASFHKILKIIGREK